MEADKPRITQVISNLLRNALKFTNDGEICVNVEKDDIAKVILVSIRDTGAGIDPEILSRLFTKFATKSFEGTGLGLYISKSIVEVMAVEYGQKTTLMETECPFHLHFH